MMQEAYTYLCVTAREAVSSQQPDHTLFAYRRAAHLRHSILWLVGASRVRFAELIDGEIDLGQAEPR